MSLSEEEFLEWVALAEHPTHANLFFLGAADRRITFYSQQVRALRLAHALSRLNRLHPHERIAVIGAGAAGCSAALALVSLGCRVEVFEQSEYPLALQRGSPRLLHPNIYDWPEPGALDAGANLPLLSWARNTGGAVSAAISGEINRAATPGDRQVIINRGISVKGLKRVGACWEISLGQGRGGEEFEKVILAAGFGDESLVGEATAEDYWTTAGVPAAAAERGRKLYFLSGSGDGGLTDLLGLLIDDFDHPGFTEWFLGLVPARDLSGAARAAQLHAEARGGEELTSALAEYLGPVLNRRGVPNALTRRLRPDRTVVFNTEEPGAFPFGAASLLNQVMAFALLAATADSGVVRRSHGRVTDVRRESDGRYSVEGPTLDGRRFAELFDRVWLRHGPDRGARYEPFEPYYTSYRDEHRRRVTREPRLSAPPRLHPETFEFFDAPYDSLFDHATQGARRVHREVRSRTISIALDPATGALAQRGPRAVAELAAELDALDRAYTIQLCVQPGQCDGLAPELVRLAKMSGEKVRLTTLPAHLPAWRALHPPADALQELLDTPFAPADAPAAGVITRLLDSAVLRPIEVITEAEAEQALSEEAAVESERMKGLLLRFWDLPASERRNIALRLSLLEEGDKELRDFDRYGKVLIRARNRGVLDDVEQEIAKVEAR